MRRNGRVQGGSSYWPTSVFGNEAGSPNSEVGLHVARWWGELSLHRAIQSMSHDFQTSFPASSLAHINARLEQFFAPEHCDLCKVCLPPKLTVLRDVPRTSIRGLLRLIQCENGEEKSRVVVKD